MSAKHNIVSLDKTEARVVLQSLRSEPLRPEDEQAVASLERRLERYLEHTNDINLGEGT